MKRVILLVFLICSTLALFASPVRNGRVLLTQPDGSSFYALISGDEFLKIKTTEAGEAIIQGEDGWWCYAKYDVDGNKFSSGCHVGDRSQESAAAQSRNIPYHTLTRRALEKRRSAELFHIQHDGRQRSMKAQSDQKNKAGLIILAQFSGTNEKFTYRKEDFVKMLTQKGYSVNGATGSAKEYFDDQFNGMYDFSFDVTDIVTVSKSRSYYGSNTSSGDDAYPHKMVIEACKLVDGSIDFKKYDQDGDQVVDNVFVFFAGLDEAAGASDDHIWSHAWYIYGGARENLFLDGVRIDRYACTSELDGNSYANPPMAGIGTFCHEYTHTLGLPDFYDADYDQGGYAASLWLSTSLMDGGNANNDGNTPPYLNSIEREILGLSEPIVIDKAGDYELPPINQGIYYRINTSTEDEYFLIEYRDKKGWDKYIGGQGVLIYHVDKSKNDAGYSYLYEKNISAYDRWSSQVEINALSSHQCADLIEADKRKDSFTSYDDNTYWNLMRSLQGVFFPYGNVNYLTPLTTPGLKGWGATAVDYAITNIAIADGKATFSAIGFSDDAIPTPTKISKEIYQDCVILRFNSDLPFVGNARVVYNASGQKAETVIVPSYKEGSWVVELDRLKPMTSYTVQITFVQDGVSGETVETTFMTKKQEDGVMPYIYFGGASRNDDGSFQRGTIIPLRVYNSSDAVSVKWSFDGSTVKRDDDLHYRLIKSGVLKAYITWEDGSEEVIIKNIKVK